MNEKEIKSVFDRVFNGLPNPMFPHPYKYFEHKGYLCECATSATKCECALYVSKNLHKTPLAIFGMAFADCGNALTVLTADGERTPFGGPFRTEQEFEALLAEI